MIASTGIRSGLAGNVVEEFESCLNAVDANRHQQNLVQENTVLDDSVEGACSDSEICGEEDDAQGSQAHSQTQRKRMKVDDDKLISRVRERGVKRNGAHVMAVGVGGALHAIAKAMETRNQEGNNNWQFQQSSMAAISEGYASTAQAIQNLESSINANFDRLTQTVLAFLSQVSNNK